MKAIKLLKYALFALVFAIMTSFNPEKVYPNLEGGESQTETPIVND